MNDHYNSKYTQRKLISIKRPQTFIQQFLLHRYLHNIQLSLDCLGQNVSMITVSPKLKLYKAIIHLSYINHQHTFIYAHSIHDHALDSGKTDDFPILISDHGNTLTRLCQNYRFRPQYIEAWLDEIANQFNVILDIQSPAETIAKYKFCCNPSQPSLTCLTHYQNIDQQLCSFIAFIITVYDTYNLCFRGGKSHAN